MRILILMLLIPFVGYGQDCTIKTRVDGNDIVIGHDNIRFMIKRGNKTEASLYQRLQSITMDSHIDTINASGCNFAFGFIASNNDTIYVNKRHLRFITKAPNGTANVSINNPVYSWITKDLFEVVTANALLQDNVDIFYNSFVKNDSVFIQSILGDTLYTGRDSFPDNQQISFVDSIRTIFLEDGGFIDITDSIEFDYDNSILSLYLNGQLKQVFLPDKVNDADANPLNEAWIISDGLASKKISNQKVTFKGKGSLTAKYNIFGDTLSFEDTPQYLQKIPGTDIYILTQANDTIGFVAGNNITLENNNGVFTIGVDSIPDFIDSIYTKGDSVCFVSNGITACAQVTGVDEQDLLFKQIGASYYLDITKGDSVQFIGGNNVNLVVTPSAMVINSLDTSGYNNEFYILEDSIYIGDYGGVKYVSLKKYITGYNKALSFINDTLTLTDDSTSFSVYIPDTSGYNDTFYISNDTIFLGDAASEKFVVLPPSDSTDELQVVDTFYISNDTIYFKLSHDTLKYVYFKNGLSVSEDSLIYLLDKNKVYLKGGDSISIVLSGDTITFNSTLTSITDSIGLLGLVPKPTNEGFLYSDGTWIPVYDTSGIISNVYLDNDTLFIVESGVEYVIPLVDTSGYNKSLILENDTLKLTDGQYTLSIHIPDSDISGYNESFTKIGNQISITDDNSTLSVYVYDTSGYNKSFFLSGNSLSLIDDGGSISINLSKFAVDTSGYNSAFYILNNRLYIVDENSTKSVNLAPYLSGYNQQLYIQNDSLYITDDNSTLSVSLPNQYNTDFYIDGTNLYIEDGNSTLFVELPAGYDSLYYVGDQLFLSGDQSTLSTNIYKQDFQFTTINDNRERISLDNSRFDLDVSGSMSISRDGSVLYLTAKDSQVLELTADTLAISDGNFIVLDKYLDNTDEQGFVLSTISTTTEKIGLERTGTAVYLKEGDNIALQRSGETITISANVDAIFDTIYFDSLLYLVIEGDTTIVPFDIGERADTSGYNYSFTRIGDSLYITDGLGTLSIYAPTFKLPVDSITFTNNSSTVTQGELQFDDEQGFLKYGGIDDVELKVNKDDVWLVKNETGGDIPKGKLLMVVGTDGNSGHLLVDYMQASNLQAQEYVLGISMHTILNDTFGYVMSKGILKGVNLSGYSDSTILWADPFNPGDFITEAPQSGALKLPVAFVVSNKNNGVMAVRVKTGESLHQLHDVKFMDLQSNQILKYQMGWWVNAQDSALTELQVKDYVGEMIVDSLNERIDVGFNPSTRNLSFVVDNDLANYSNANSQFLTQEVDGDTTNELQVIDSFYLNNETLSIKLSEDTRKDVDLSSLQPTLTDGYVGYGSSLNNLTGESDFTYNATNNSVSLTNAATATGTPEFYINSPTGSDNYTEFRIHNRLASGGARALLSVMNRNNESFNLTMTNDEYATSLDLDNAAFFVTPENNDMVFMTAGSLSGQRTSKIRFIPGGYNNAPILVLGVNNVGIGKTDPTYPVHVGQNMKLDAGLADVNNSYGTLGEVLTSGATGVEWSGSNFTWDAANNILDINGKIDVGENASTFVGTNTGLVNTASYNTGFGRAVLASNTTGEGNTGMGYGSLQLNTIGEYNVAIGYNSMRYNTEGNRNVGIGFSTLFSNITGIGNVALGQTSLYYNTIGSNNLAIGDRALQNLGYLTSTSSSSNIGIGQLAGATREGVNSLRISDNSIYIGDNTAPGANDVDNVIVIGGGAIGQGSNTTTIGNTSTTLTRLYGDLELLSNIKDSDGNLGTQGELLTVNANGDVIWADGATFVDSPIDSVVADGTTLNFYDGGTIVASVEITDTRVDIYGDGVLRSTNADRLTFNSADFNTSTTNTTSGQVTVNLDKTGDWTGTFDGQQGTYYLDNTDDQKIDVFSLIGNNLTLSLENDGESNKIVSLASYLDNTDDQTASEVSFTPTGTITSTNVQEAIAELEGDISGITAGDFGTVGNNQLAYGSADTLTSSSSLTFNNTNKTLAINESSPFGMLSIQQNGTTDLLKFQDESGNDLMIVDGTGRLYLYPEGGQDETTSVQITHSSGNPQISLLTDDGNNVNISQSDGSLGLPNRLRFIHTGDSDKNLTYFQGGKLGVNVGADIDQEFDVNGDARLRGALFDSTNSSGTAGQVLTSNGANAWSWETVSGGGAASLTATYVGFGDGSNQLTGSSDFTFDDATNELKVTGNLELSDNGSIFIGQDVGDYETGTRFTTAIGYRAYSNSLATGGGYNAMYGAYSGRNLFGGYNSFFGAQSGSQISIGAYNTFAGYAAGMYNVSGLFVTSGNYNTLLGQDARMLNNGDNNSIVIGSQGRGEGSNTTVIGNTSTELTYLYGDLQPELGIIDENSSTGTAGQVLGVGVTGVEWQNPTDLITVPDPTLTASYIGYGSASNELTGDSALIWDAANNILDISGKIAIASGDNSIFIGGTNGASCVTCRQNVAVGVQALQSITTGYENFALGYDALKFLQAGGYNIAIGRGALQNFNASGSNNNIAIGRNAGNTITTGLRNTIIGSATSNITTGSNNVLIGHNAEVLNNTDANSIVIGGINADGLGSNTTVIGNGSTELTYLYGDLQPELGIIDENSSAGTLGEILTVGVTGIEWSGSNFTFDKANNVLDINSSVDIDALNVDIYTDDIDIETGYTFYRHNDGTNNSYLTMSTTAVELKYGSLANLPAFAIYNQSDLLETRLFADFYDGVSFHEEVEDNNQNVGTKNQVLSKKNDQVEWANVRPPVVIDTIRTDTFIVDFDNNTNGIFEIQIEPLDSTYIIVDQSGSRYESGINFTNYENGGVYRITFKSVSGYEVPGHGAYGSNHFYVQPGLFRTLNGNTLDTNGLWFIEGGDSAYMECYYNGSYFVVTTYQTF